MLGVIQLGEIFDRVLDVCSDELTEEFETVGAYEFTDEEHKLMKNAIRITLESYLDHVGLALDIVKESSAIYSAIETRRNCETIVKQNASRPALVNFINGAKKK